MATKQSPVQCVTCRQPVPEDIEELNYFAQTTTRPAADDVENFLAELRDLTEYIETLFVLLCNVNKSALDESQLYSCHGLGWELALEAKRRVRLALGAWELCEERPREEPA